MTFSVLSLRINISILFRSRYAQNRTDSKSNSNFISSRENENSYYASLETPEKKKGAAAILGYHVDDKTNCATHTRA